MKWACSLGRSEAMGMYRKTVWAQVTNAGRCKAESQGIRPIQDENGEHFVSGVGCGKMQVTPQVAQARKSCGNQPAGAEDVADGES